MTGTPKHKCRVSVIADAQKRAKCEACNLRAESKKNIRVCATCEILEAPTRKCGTVALVRVKETGGYYCEDHAHSMRFDAQTPYHLLYLDEMDDMWVDGPPPAPYKAPAKEKKLTRKELKALAFGPKVGEGMVF